MVLTSSHFNLTMFIDRINAYLKGSIRVEADATDGSRCVHAVKRIILIIIFILELQSLLLFWAVASKAPKRQAFKSEVPATIFRLLSIIRLWIS